MRISPQAASMLAGVGFRGSELAGPIVLHVAPGEPVADHLSVDEPLTQVDSADFALVAVDVDHLDANSLPEHFAGEILAGLCPKRLALLGGVDPREPDLVLRFNPSRTVSVSPSAIATTRPVSS